MTVQAANGEKYRIHRRWLPWRRRANFDWLPGGDTTAIGLGDDPLSLIVLAIIVIPIVLVLAFVVGEFLLLLLLLLVLPFFVLARSIFGTPWVIEITHQRELMHAEEVRGWSASQQRINDLVTATGQGDLPPGVEQRVRAKVRKAREEARNKVRNSPRTRLWPSSTARLRQRPGRRRRPGLRTGLRPGLWFRTDLWFRTRLGYKTPPRSRTRPGFTTRPNSRRGGGTPTRPAPRRARPTHPGMPRCGRT